MPKTKCLIQSVIILFPSDIIIANTQMDLSVGIYIPQVALVFNKVLSNLKSQLITVNRVGSGHHSQ